MTEFTIDELPSIQWISPAYWAIDAIKINGNKFSLKDTPYMVELYHNAGVVEEMVVSKGAQLRFTTWGIISTLWFLHNPIFSSSGLYLFPTKSQGWEFTSARLDPMIEESPGLQESKISGLQKTDNKGLKTFGNRSLYMRGTESKSQLVEIPAAWQVLDELDKFKQHRDFDLLSLVRERASGSETKFFKFLSNPTFPDVGIDHMYLDSSMGVWEIQCEGCGRWQELDFFKNVDLEAPERGVFCRWCSKGLNRLKPGRWHHRRKHDRKGYTLSQLYSPTVSVAELINKYHNCQGELDLMTFYNMGLGRAYSPKGGKLTEDELFRCISTEYRKGEKGEGEHFLGIDVGQNLDWVIIDEDDNVRDWGECKDPDEISRLIEEWDIFFFVIDAQPETRMSVQLCEDWQGRGAICYHTANDGETERPEDNARQINRNRELWLDRMFTQIRKRGHRFPPEIRDEPSFKQHLTTLVKVTQPVGSDETKGNIVKFLRYGKPDHKALGLHYARLAKALFKPVSVTFV